MDTTDQSETSPNPLQKEMDALADSFNAAATAANNNKRSLQSQSLWNEVEKAHAHAVRLRSEIKAVKNDQAKLVELIGNFRLVTARLHELAATDASTSPDDIKHVESSPEESIATNEVEAHSDYDIDKGHIADAEVEPRKRSNKHSKAKELLKKSQELFTQGPPDTKNSPQKPSS